MTEKMREEAEKSGAGEDCVRVGAREVWKHSVLSELERQTGGDVMLVSGVFRVACHSAILAASSPMLKELLIEQTRDGEGESFLSLPDWGRAELDLAVKLLHNGEVLLRPDERELGERVASLMSSFGMKGVEVGQFKCFRCSVVQPDVDAYLNHLDSEHGAQAEESIRDMIKELENKTGDPEFEDWTCMGCFVTDLLPGKKCDIVDSQAAALSLENHLLQCTQAVEKEKERVDRMQKKDDNDKPLSLAASLDSNLWRSCPLCGESKRSRDEMVTHLIFYHPQLKAILDKTIANQTPLTCEDGCMPIWPGRSTFLLHKFINCEKGAKRRLELILRKLTKTDVLGEELSEDGLGDISDISEDEIMEELVLEVDVVGGGQSTIASKEEIPKSEELEMGFPKMPMFSNASSQTSVNSDLTLAGKVEDQTVSNAAKAKESLIGMVLNQGCQTSDDDLKERCPKCDDIQACLPKTTQQGSQTIEQIVNQELNGSLPEDQCDVFDQVGTSGDKEVYLESVNAKVSAPDNTSEDGSSDIGGASLKSQKQNMEPVDESNIKCPQCHGIFETTSKFKSKIKHFCKFLGGKLSQRPEIDSGAKSGAKRVTMTCSLCR